jgi:hypothetical protein
VVAIESEVERRRERRVREWVLGLRWRWRGGGWWWERRSWGWSVKERAMMVE